MRGLSSRTNTLTPLNVNVLAYCVLVIYTTFNVPRKVRLACYDVSCCRSGATAFLACQSCWGFHKHIVMARERCFVKCAVYCMILQRYHDYFLTYPKSVSELDDAIESPSKPLIATFTSHQSKQYRHHHHAPNPPRHRKRPSTTTRRHTSPQAPSLGKLDSTPPLLLDRARHLCQRLPLRLRRHHHSRHLRRHQLRLRCRQHRQLADHLVPGNKYRIPTFIRPLLRHLRPARVLLRIHDYICSGLSGMRPCDEHRPC